MNRMRRMTAALVLAITLFAASLAQSPAREPVDVLEGLDPVLLTQGKEVQGDLQLTITRGRFKYYFGTTENKAAFEKDPRRYEIQLEGACARMGAPVTGNPDLFTVHNGRIYIFGSEECKKRFTAAPEKYIETKAAPTGNSAATPAAMKRGQALLEKAVAAMGGATALDRLTSYRERSTTWQRRQNGDVEVKKDLLIAFPDRIRQEQAMPDFRDPSKEMRQTLVLLPGEAFGIGGPRGIFPVQPAFRLLEEQEIGRNPVNMLRSRKSPGFTAAALDATGGSVEQVSIDSGGVVYVLGIDPSSGRILSLSYRRRGPEGFFGQLVQTFSDFRTVNGLTLPFKVTATFDGQPWKEQSADVQEIVINEKVAPEVFEKPPANKP